MLPIRNPEVVYQPVADGAVLFSPRDEVYFGLNATGVRVWEALAPTNATWDELCVTLEAAWPGVDPGTLRADATELVRDLLAQRLLLPARAPLGVDAL